MNIKTSSKLFPYFTMEVKESMLPDIKMLYNKGLLKNACLIYSMWDGYIEKEEKLNSFIEEIKNMNIDFIELHTSGHADLSAMKLMNKKLNPNSTIIIHTDDGEKGKNIFNNVVNIQDGEYINVE